MLNLMKYEFKKNRTGLAVMGIIFALTEVFFLWSTFVKKDVDMMAVGAGFLTLFVLVAYCYVMYVGINNYEKELTSKCSQLIYMTPNSSLKIILSKYLYTLLLGIGVCAIIGGVGTIDLSLVAKALDEEYSVITAIREFMKYLGQDLDKYVVTLLVYIINVVVNFFAIVAICYLTVTSTFTVFQRGKFQKGISIILTVVALIVYMIVEGKIGVDAYVNDFGEGMLLLVPSILYNIGIIGVSIFICSKLLDKYLSV